MNGSAGPIQVDLVDTDSVFEGLRTEWAALLPASGSASVFLTHAWLWTWWRHFGEGRRLCIFRFRDDDGPIGIAPFMRVEEPAGRVALKALGDPLSDHHDVIVTRRREDCLRALCDAVAEAEPRASYLELRLIPEDSPNLAAWRALTHPKCWVAQVPMQILEQAAPVVNLQGTWAEYLATRSSALRHDVGRKAARRLERAGRVRLVEVATPEGVRALVRQVAEWSQVRFGRVSLYRDARVTAFYEALAHEGLAHGWVDAARLEVDGRAVAAHFGFRFEGTLHYYQPAFDSAFEAGSPGKVLVRLLIERAFAQGLHRVDLGRGLESYKRAWATETVPLRRVEVIPKRPRAGASFLFRRARYVATRAYHTVCTRAS